MRAKLTIILILLFLVSCKCPESASIVNFSETNLPEYKIYIENDKNLTSAQKRIRLMRIETFKAVADGLK